MEYKIIRSVNMLDPAKTINELTNEVNEHLAAGWKVAGGLAVSVPMLGSPEMPTPILFQAMVRGDD
ncbi:hypothetical protein AWV79_35670 [Cupriavidus sp. UYMMa02A]|nr:hypothetical protein AWV79_35670 [Cupriavidus sp. UYMMa02A]